MPEQAVTSEETPVAQEPVKAPEQDLITRVSQLKVETKVPEKQEQTNNNDNDGKFNINDLDTQIEKIPDPVLKEQVLGLKKSLLRGENQKYQEIANLRKSYEQKLAETTTWTKERLQQELNKQDFVQAANEVLKTQNPTTSGLSDEQWSALSETERTELKELKQKINFLEQTNMESLKVQQDVVMKSKYANYDPSSIDSLTNDLMSRKINATREHLWKVIDYENAVRRAYELGKQDKLTENNEKVTGMSFDTGRNIATPKNVDRQKGETAQQFFVRSYQEHTKKK